MGQPSEPVLTGTDGGAPGASMRLTEGGHVDLLICNSNSHMRGFIQYCTLGSRNTCAIAKVETARAQGVK